MADLCPACSRELPAGRSPVQDFCDDVCARAWRYVTQTDQATAPAGGEVHRSLRADLAVDATVAGRSLPLAATVDGPTGALEAALQALSVQLWGAGAVWAQGGTSPDVELVVGARCDGPDCGETFRAFLSPAAVLEEREARGQLADLAARFWEHQDQHAPAHWHDVASQLFAGTPALEASGT